MVYPKHPREILELAIANAIAGRKIPYTQSGAAELQFLVSQAIGDLTLPGYTIFVEPLTEEDRALGRLPAITLLIEDELSIFCNTNDSDKGE